MKLGNRSINFFKIPDGTTFYFMAGAYMRHFPLVMQGEKFSAVTEPHLHVVVAENLIAVAKHRLSQVNPNHNWSRENIGGIVEDDNLSCPESLEFWPSIIFGVGQQEIADGLVLAEAGLKKAKEELQKLVCNH